MGNLVDIKRCVKEEKCLVRGDQNVALVYNFRKLFNKQKMSWECYLDLHVTPNSLN